METTDKGPRRRHLIIIGAGLTVLAVAGLFVRDPPAPWEEALFRYLNGLPHNVEGVLWVLQQLGSALVLPIAALVLWWGTSAPAGDVGDVQGEAVASLARTSDEGALDRSSRTRTQPEVSLDGLNAANVAGRGTKRWQPPLALVSAGFLFGWLGAKVVKALVGRGRPGAILDDVVLGFDVPIAEVGFPSGHAVLAFTLAVAFAPYLGRRGRLVAIAVATVVAVTRVYVGAHLPLDVIGGAGYGIAIGSLVTLVSGRVGDSRPPDS